MSADEDIAAALPRPPLPAPARREAAIEMALRRFDGESARPAAATRAPRPTSWRIPAIRPWAGAVAGAVLVALVALPIMLSSPDGVIRPEPDGERVGEAPRPDRSVAAGPAASPSTDRPAPSPAGTHASPAPAKATRPGGPGADDEARFADAATPPPPPPPPEPASAPGRQGKAAEPEPAARAGQTEAGLVSRDVTVTGTRIRNPDMTASSAVTTISEEDDSDIVLTATRRGNAKASQRGDWNACTVDDPKQSLSGCRSLVNPAARGAAGQAAARIADGLALAWEGDIEEAIGKFDQAIAIAPKSAFAYLNRGLARRRIGDLDGALADLDRAVLHARTSARAYYNRSRVLRERGDARRARADEGRAVDLDPDYGEIVE